MFYMAQKVFQLVEKLYLTLKSLFDPLKETEPPEKRLAISILNSLPGTNVQTKSDETIYGENNNMFMFFLSSDKINSLYRRKQQ